MSYRALVLLQWWSSFTGSWQQMLYSQGLVLRNCTMHCKKKSLQWMGFGREGADLPTTSQETQEAKTRPLQQILLCRASKTPHPRKSPSRSFSTAVYWVSQCNERWLPMPSLSQHCWFSGQAGKKKKKLNTVFCEKKNAVLKVITTGYHHYSDSHSTLIIKCVL